MKVVIIEDEKQARNVLKHLLLNIRPDIEIVTSLETVRDAIHFFQTTTMDYELIFMDIQLGDGISFDIIEKIQPGAPIIFTTAYDEYAIKAFRTNSIDYLLKPINEQALQQSLDKYHKILKNQYSNALLKTVLEEIKKDSQKYKSSFLVKTGEKYVPISIDDIAFIYIRHGIVKAVDFQNKQFVLDKKLEEIEFELNPGLFFRVNRQYIFQKKAIKSLHKYFKGKLLLKSQPVSYEQIEVSSARARELKKWLS